MASRQGSIAQQVPPGSILLVVHDFVARSPDELSLAKGDRIELIERDDDFGDGWFLGRHMTSGSTGLFPEVYTTPAPKGTLPASSNQHRGHGPSPLSGSTPTTPTTPILPSRITDDSPKPELTARYSVDLNSQRPRSSGGPQSSLRSSILASNNAQARGTPQGSTHNSVMHETLSVIDEHITDLRTPRQGYRGVGRPNHDTDSVYSSHDGHRMSYINGHETDEEEQQHLHTEAEVMAWSPARAAEYLEDHGVEQQHCDIFREQEISGEVLLHMEQSAVFIKEFELGSVGRRLKTWQKIKELQDEVRAATIPGIPRSVSDYSVAGDESQSEGPSRNRSFSAAAATQRPATASASSSSPAGFAERNLASQQSNFSSSNASPLQSTNPSTSRAESTSRPSAASVRSLTHSRRHSSFGSIDAGPAPLSSRFSHQKQPSSSGSIAASSAAVAAARRRSSAHEQRFTKNSQHDSPTFSDFGFGTLDSPLDLDRGYFSGNEVDNRTKRNVLQKKTSPSHSRNPSSNNDAAGHASHFKNYGRVASAESIRDPVSPLVSPSSAQFPFKRLTDSRAATNPQPTAGNPLPLRALQAPASPIVTKFEYGDLSNVVDSDNSSVNPSPSPGTLSFSIFHKPRIGGLRVTSDTVTQNEKRAQNAAKASPVTSPTRTGSTTPSTDTRSFDLQKPEPQSRVSTGSSSALALPVPTTRSRAKTKTKKSTSAYTRGLEHKTPAEQIAGCDYSGWMKKKSSNLMGSWKPRLFVLRGRRLSYYYSENDTEEKGLIDISSHRVLPAENERITGFYAALTGASSSPIMPVDATTPTSAATDLAAKPGTDADDQGLFIFKLVPPRQGLSKAVNFTKPAVHYFAVNSRQEGRLWMAALMKATIDYDASDGKVVTSYSQKTISLAKARARNERPPALRHNTDEQGGTHSGTQSGAQSIMAELEGATVESPMSSISPIITTQATGLGIRGLDSPIDSSVHNTIAGARKEDAGSTASTGGET